MKIIDTAKLTPDSELSQSDNKQIYCGLDSCVTLEVWDVIHKQLDPTTKIIYNFSLALQAPVLEMIARGLPTDSYEVNKLLYIYEKRRDRIKWIIDQYAFVIWGRPLNPSSPKQLCEFFYQVMNIPEVIIFDKGKRRVAANREAMEKIQQYRYGRPIATAILAFRDMSKKIGVLKSGIDDDGHMRFSYNIGGTNTGRFSCNKNVFGGGTNGQNITDELRRIFVAPDGKKFAYLDLQQAESRGTGYLSGDEKYIEACESEDLHVFVAKIIWPEVNWSGDPKLDKEKAEIKFWRHWSRRDLSKRGGHLTNYYGQPHSNAKQLHISVEVMKEFYRTYLGEFSGIRRWHTDVARIIQTTSTITTPLGRKRLFFGRTYEDDILRKAIAFGPQSSIGDILNLGMWRIWKHLPEVELVAQLHDAVLIQYPDEIASSRQILARARALMTIPVNVTDTKYRAPTARTMIIPVDVVTGWNWAKYHSTGNPDGLLPYSGDDGRQRQVFQSTGILQRTM